MKQRHAGPLFALFTLPALVAPLAAQRAAVTAADYARAVGGAVAPTWLPDDRFWYRNQTAAGTEIVVVDAVKKTRTAYPDCAAAGLDCAAPADTGGRGGRGGIATVAAGSS